MLNLKWTTMSENGAGTQAVFRADSSVKVVH
jgi:protein subunit release factor A